MVKLLIPLKKKKKKKKKTKTMIKFFFPLKKKKKKKSEVSNTNDVVPLILIEINQLYRNHQDHNTFKNSYIIYK